MVPLRAGEPGARERLPWPPGPVWGAGRSARRFDHAAAPACSPRSSSSMAVEVDCAFAALVDDEHVGVSWSCMNGDTVVRDQNAGRHPGGHPDLGGDRTKTHPTSMDLERSRQPSRRSLAPFVRAPKRPTTIPASAQSWQTNSEPSRAENMKALVRRAVAARSGLGDRSSAPCGGRRRSSPPWDQRPCPRGLLL
jgi:hypothetical protein